MKKNVGLFVLISFLLMSWNFAFAEDDPHKGKIEVYYLNNSGNGIFFLNSKLNIKNSVIELQYIPNNKDIEYMEINIGEWFMGNCGTTLICSAKIKNEPLLPGEKFKVTTIPVPNLKKRLNLVLWVKSVEPPQNGFVVLETDMINDRLWGILSEYQWKLTEMITYDLPQESDHKKMFNILSSEIKKWTSTGNEKNILFVNVNYSYIISSKINVDKSVVEFQYIPRKHRGYDDKFNIGEVVNEDNIVYVCSGTIKDEPYQQREFLYKVKTPEGKIVQGVVTAKDGNFAIRKLHTMKQGSVWGITEVKKKNNPKVITVSIPSLKTRGDLVFWLNSVSRPIGTQINTDEIKQRAIALKWEYKRLAELISGLSDKEALKVLTNEINKYFEE